MLQSASYISEILLLHGVKYTDYEKSLGKSSRTAWKYTKCIPKVKQLLAVQPAISNVCGVPISSQQLLIDPTVTWEHDTWTYQDNVNRYCNQNSVVILSLSEQLQIEYGTFNRQLKNPLSLDCNILVALSQYLSLSVDNLLSAELSWEFGKKPVGKKHYRKVAVARSRVVDVEKVLDSW